MYPNCSSMPRATTLPGLTSMGSIKWSVSSRQKGSLVARPSQEHIFSSHFREADFRSPDMKWIGEFHGNWEPRTILWCRNYYGSRPQC